MVSNIAQWAFTNRQINSLNERQNLGVYRNTTGNLYQELRDYGTDANRIVDFRAEISRRTEFEGTLKNLANSVEAYEDRLDSLYKIANDLRRYSIDSPPQDYDANWSQTNERISDGLLLSVSEDLNAEFGGRYLFGGQRWDEAPVRDLRELVPYGASDAFERLENGAIQRLKSNIETGTRTGAENQLPQVRYEAQSLARNKIVPNIYTNVGVSFSESIDKESLTTGSGETLDYELTVVGGGALPDWLSFDKDKMQLSGRAPANAVNLQLELRAKNYSDETITSVFNLDVRAAGAALPPNQTAGIAGATYFVGVPLSVDIPTNVFQAQPGQPALGPPTVAFTPATAAASLNLVVDNTNPARPLYSIQGTLPAGTRGDITATVSISSGGEAREYRIIIREKDAPEYLHQSYLNRADLGPPQAGGLAVPYRPPTSFDEKLWARNELPIADKLVVPYGYSAADRGFQLLVESIMRFKSATQKGLTQEQRKSFVESAHELAQDAKDAISSLSTDNAVNKATFEEKAKNHSSANALLEKGLSNISTITSEQASLELIQLQSQLRASYSAIARQAELSLVNFLK